MNDLCLLIDIKQMSNYCAGLYVTETQRNLARNKQ